MMPNEKMYKKGIKVWIPHPSKVWESAIILQDFDADQKALFVLTDDSRETKIINVNSPAELPPFHLSEDSLLDTKSNLSSLAAIHEATILQILRRRFDQHCNYSYCGATTIALNPYYLTVDINSEMWKYRNSNLSNLEAHIFGVAENAYANLYRENCDQTIIFTGESGSGKSLNAQRAISYLTTVSSKSDQVKEKISASFAILHAFGHAPTALNNDSSRYGTFFQMELDKNYQVIGGLLTAYNLDRSNVISQGNHFNIFYYMYAAREDLSHLQLNDNKFKFLENTLYHKISFNKTNMALDLLGFSKRLVGDIHKILAVVLHLQTLAFKGVEGSEGDRGVQNCTIADPSHLEAVGNVLGLNEEGLNRMKKSLCYRRIYRDQNLIRPMNVEQAIKARDALVKLIYAKLFNWLVLRINAGFRFLRTFQQVESLLGILDMHGFEKLHYNSFEQFCINYIDEKIEQLFIRSNLKLEQEEYIREEISWRFIPYSDNRLNVALIDGILDLLEEETKMSSANDMRWLEVLRGRCERTRSIETTVATRTNFTIQHFIRPVKYNANEFLAKNYEAVTLMQFEAFHEIKIALLSQFMYELEKLAQVDRKILSIRQSTSKLKWSQQTVIDDLRSSLNVLYVALSKTKTCFVRCIKSNDEKKAMMFDSQRVIEQLRAFNVCETIEISAVGYFQPKCYNTFIERYYYLCEYKDLKQENRQEVCEKIVAAYSKKDDVRLGKTKVYLRKDTMIYLENIRLICGIQRYARGSLVRQRMKIIQNNNIQSFLNRRTYRELLERIIKLQSFVRPNLAMIKKKSLKYENNQHFSVINKSIVTTLMQFQTEIIYVMMRMVSSKELESVLARVKNQKCEQTKVRILNKLLYRRIKNLPIFGVSRKPYNDAQVEHSQPDSLRAFDTPMVTQRDKSKLHKKLRKLDRHAKLMLHKTDRFFTDPECSKLIGYCMSVRRKPNKSLENSNSSTPQKYHSKGVGVLEGPIQKHINRLVSDMIEEEEESLDPDEESTQIKRRKLIY